jgi:hypothetical protein
VLYACMNGAEMACSVRLSDEQQLLVATR